MTRLTGGFALRLASLATALVVGPAALAPGTASTPVVTARGEDGATAAQKFGWRNMLWDFAWEFGESLDSHPYRGTVTKAGRWEEFTDGTGRVVKYGGGLEFHTGYVRRGTDEPDRGTIMATLRDLPDQSGRWELRERAETEESDDVPYPFVIELIPDDPAGYDCGAHNLTIARVVPGDGSVEIGVNAGTTKWTRTFTGYPQSNDNYAFAVQVTGGRITWFISGQAVASLGASAAIPKVPMTLRMRMIGDGDKDMRKATVRIDWARHYDLKRGKLPPRGQALYKGTNTDTC